MLKRKVVRFICAASAVAALTSCGDSKSGGTGEFATMYATATPPAATLDSDEATWVDATGTAASACVTGSSPTFASDDATYTITAVPYASSTNAGPPSTIGTSDLIINKITLTLTRSNTTTPLLPARFQTQYLSAGQRIKAGDNSIVVRVVSDELKQYLAPDLLCTGAVYSYDATVSFEALEVNTNRSAIITTKGPLRVSLKDVVDQ